MNTSEAALQLMQQQYSYGMAIGICLGIIMTGSFVLFALYIHYNNNKFRKTIFSWKTIMVGEPC